MTDRSNRIFESRMRLGVTQEIFAKMLGITKNYVYLLESGRKPITSQITEKLNRLDQIKFSKIETSYEKFADGFLTPKTVLESGDLRLTEEEHRILYGDKNDHTHGCSMCAQKDEEIRFLRHSLQEALSRIPKS